MSTGFAAFPEGLLTRIEDAGINASAPREQLWIDGWLVRFSPGKAKRARCIQAVAAGRLPLEERLHRCLDVYAKTGLHPFVRITPFSEPLGLDEELAKRGMESIDDTRVMVALLDADRLADPLPTGLRVEAVDGEAYAEWVGGHRGSAPSARLAHAERLRQSPVRHVALLLKGADSTTVAGGQVAIEADLAGLYDVFTPEASRGRGHSGALCRALLRTALENGARTGYLQVEADNDPARAVYARLGFADAYSYHYRTPPGGGGR